MSLHTLVFRYSVFAVLATLANLATQRLFLSAGDTTIAFPLAVGAGTLVGLGVKYALDKRWIFYDLRSGFAYHRRTFTLYTMMGLLTTAIFWGTETAFWLTWRTDVMRELGAVIGLAVGYTVKYLLDRRYVFTNAALAVRAEA